MLDRTATPTFAGLAYKAAAEVGLGDLTAARDTVSALGRAFPAVGLDVFRRNGRRFAFRDDGVQTRFIEALRQAGLTERTASPHPQAAWRGTAVHREAHRPWRMFAFRANGCKTPNKGRGQAWWFSGSIRG